MKLIYLDKEQIFVAQSKFEEKDIPKNARFSWDKIAKRWWTGDPDKARELAKYADEYCRAKLTEIADERRRARQASRATDSFASLPIAAGQEYLGYQKAGIVFATSRPGALIADDMGLGKTVQGIGAVNVLDERMGKLSSVLVICPASLKVNWKREFGRFLANGEHAVEIATSSYFPPSALISGAIVIINYDILAKWATKIQNTKWDLLIVDEAHYVKNPKSIRSKQVYAIKATYRLFLTGTPIVNRPKELWPIISSLDPKTWNSWWSFARDYCDAQWNGYGWDFSGASNLDRLQRKLRETIMVRRLKQDVLKELPPKRRQIIELPANGAEKALKAEFDEFKSRIADSDEDFEAVINKLSTGDRKLFDEIALIRKKTAQIKAPLIIDYVGETLEESAQKIIVFCHHQEIAERFRTELFRYKPAMVHGAIPLPTRQAEVDRFQNDPDCRMFVGTIGAAGVGLTLTAASHVLFAETDWVPGRITQAEDRAHRIGQTDSVLVQHCVLEGSLDAYMVHMVVEKQKVIREALDREVVK